MSARGVLAGALLLAGACADDAGELRRVAFEVELSGAASSELRTALGWDVTLSAAELSVAAAYFRNAAPGSGTTDEEGRVVAQVLGPFTIDALAASTERAEVEANALTEQVRSAELWLTEAEEGPIADALGSGRALAHVAGVARRDDRAIPFDLGLRFPVRDDARAYEATQNRRIRRLRAEFVPSAGGVLRISVDPSRFLDAVPFDALGPEGGTRDLTSDGEQLQLRNGLAAVSGYGFDFQP